MTAAAIMIFFIALFLCAVTTSSYAALTAEQISQKDAEEDGAGFESSWVKDFIICNIPNGKRFDVGIEFLTINEEDEKRIDKYVFSHVETEE